MIDTDVSSRLAGRRRGLARSFFGVAVAVALLAGLVWLGFSAWQALHLGRLADVHRRWVTCQYVRNGVNPYPITLAALEHRYGRPGNRPELPLIYAIPHLTPAEAGDDPRIPTKALPLLAAYGPPEAVYPPPAQLLLSLTLGWLPEESIYGVWVIMNLALLAGLAWLMGRREPGAASRTPLAVAGVVALLLAWPPTQETVFVGQFSLLVAVCVLLGFRWLDRHEYAAGALLSLALVKPSLALPFLIVPLVRGRWRALAVVAVSQLAALGVQSYRFGRAPWTLLHQWVETAGYFTQGGQYTLQDLVIRLHLVGTPAALALEVGFVLAAWAWCWWNRNAADALLIDLLCFVSILWTYHEPYDFVIVLVPLVRRLATVPDAGRPARAVACLPALGPLVCLALATSRFIFNDESHVAAKVVRDVARLVLALGFAVLVVQAWRAARAASSQRGAAPARARPSLALAGQGQAA